MRGNTWQPAVGAVAVGKVAAVTSGTGGGAGNGGAGARGGAWGSAAGGMSPAVPAYLLADQGRPSCRASRIEGKAEGFLEKG